MNIQALPDTLYRFKSQLQAGPYCSTLYELLRIRALSKPYFKNFLVSPRNAVQALHYLGTLRISKLVVLVKELRIRRAIRTEEATDRAFSTRMARPERIYF